MSFQRCDPADACMHAVLVASAFLTKRRLSLRACMHPSIHPLIHVLQGVVCQTTISVRLVAGPFVVRKAC
jgi:hypothetical protein